LAWGVNQEVFIMSSPLIAVRDDGRMSSPGPRSGAPTSRRSFTSAQKLDHLAAYEAALARGQGGA
jgi:transposase